jgi:hypothetical protein
MLRVAASTPVSEMDYHKIVQILRHYDKHRQSPQDEQEVLARVGWPATYHPCDHMEKIRFVLLFTREGCPAVAKLCQDYYAASLFKLSLHSSELSEPLKNARLKKLSPSELGDARVFGRHVCGPCKSDEWHHGLYVGKFFGHSRTQVIQMSQKGLTFSTVEEFAGMQLHEVTYENGTCVDPDRTMENVKKVHDHLNGCNWLTHILKKNTEQEFVTLCKTGRYGANVDEFCSGVSCLCEETEIIPFVRGNTKRIFENI